MTGSLSYCILLLLDASLEGGWITAAICLGMLCASGTWQFERCEDGRTGRRWFVADAGTPACLCKKVERRSTDIAQSVERIFLRVALERHR